jgi:hypothetical protein
VEVLLDPGATAGGGEELYRIAVKPNGVSVTERGVRSDPPLGKVTPWAPQARIAAGRFDGGWLVEMAIPRAAFGAAGRSAFWGVNFVRYSPQGYEASSWSGARRHFYDPRSLGTLFLGPPAADPGEDDGG